MRSIEFLCAKGFRLPIYKSKYFPESVLAHDLLDGLHGLEIGGSYHNAFGLDTLNVDWTDEMETEFKKAEVKLCGYAMPVDIVARGDCIPVDDKSFDFVISSHVIEHFFDPIAAIKEWRRIARRYIFIICPLRNALEIDRDKPITPFEELVDRHEGRLIPPVFDLHDHYTRWKPKGFIEMCERFGWKVYATEVPDKKVGNGFTVVLRM